MIPIIMPPNHEPLHLKEITIRRLRLHLRVPFRTAFGTQQERDTILVILKTHDGLIGVGEAPSLVAPMYDDQYIWSDYDVLQRFLVPHIPTTITSFQQLWDKTLSSIKDHHFSKCGIEAAYWNLVSQQTGESLKTLWGGEADTVVAGFSIGGQSLEDVLARAEVAVQAGFRRLKIKIWPSHDVQVMAVLRERYPDLMLQVDANCAYDPFNPNHQQALKALDDFGLLMIEQPFSPHDFLDHARFQAEQNLQTPIALDESVLSVHDARRAIEMWRLFGVGDKLILNIKPPRVGGYWQGRLIAEMGHEQGIPCWMGGMLELGVGKWMNVILASHPGCTLPGDHLQPQPYYERDIADPLPSIQTDGTIAVPSHGGGCAVDWQAVEELTVDLHTDKR